MTYHRTAAVIAEDQLPSEGETLINISHQKVYTNSSDDRWKTLIWWIHLEQRICTRTYIIILIWIDECHAARLLSKQITYHLFETQLNHVFDTLIRVFFRWLLQTIIGQCTTFLHSGIIAQPETTWNIDVNPRHVWRAILDVCVNEKLWAPDN